jgi:Ni/Fe-hydrogenase subunit HybB-like protein
MPAGPRQPIVSAAVRVPPLTAASITERISDIVLERPAGRYWWLALGVSFAAVLSLMIAVSWLFTTGIGIWGDNIPVAWGWAIADYVWWSGLALGGTFVSGALYLLRADWRTPVNRMAQTMAVISVAMAGIFPVMHLGRPWFAYWIFVYPNKMSLWPQWRSSLTWDFYGLLTFVIFAVLFWFVGLLPDVATLRDRAKRNGVKVFYGLLALGWRGEARQWRYHQTAMRLLAGAAVVIVFWVHGVVALDFSIALLPGWHETMLPIYFASGAVFSGFALLIALVIPVRRIYRLQGLITGRDLNNLAKCLLAVSLIMTYWYMMEAFMSFYSHPA